MNDSCPCKYTTPCSPTCSCGDPLQSGGCRYCCSYGSFKQRKENAKWIALAIDHFDRQCLEPGEPLNKRSL
jgi:hypothetical protein